MSNSVVAAFSEEHVQRLTGVRKQQLRYWERTDFFVPTFSDGRYREDFGRVYSFSDVVALRVLDSLRNKHGVSVQHLRQVKAKLAGSNQNAWVGVKLYVVNKRVHWVDPGTGLPQEVASGQFVFETIDLDSVVTSTKGDIDTINQRTAATIGKIDRVKSLNHSAPIIAGTRIPVRAIQRFHEAGYSAEAIIAEYPDLNQADVAAALAYDKVA